MALDESDGSIAPDALAHALNESTNILKELGAVFGNLDPAALTADQLLAARAEVGRAVERLNAPLQLLSDSVGLPSATERLREFFLIHVGDVLDKYELFGVAGALAFARRIRELAVEEGWDISRGRSGSLKPGEYRLDSDQVDQERAARWRRLREIRNSGGSAEDRLLVLLRERYPEDVSRDDLAYVAKIDSWPRRVRELAEAGWAVRWSRDDPSLPRGSYRLDSLDQGPSRSRSAIAHRHRILQRDSWACRKCGASPRDGARVHLQVHHRHHVGRGGGNEDDNLETLCAPCHAGVHALERDQVSDELLNPGADPDRPT